MTNAEPRYCARPLAGIWQRLLMFFKPNPIAQINKAAAERATFEMLGFAQ
jgi:hypothetical protein